MDAQFHPAQRAIDSDDAEEVERLLRADPTLATRRSQLATDHPYLLQCLVLAMPARRKLEHFIRDMAGMGADVNGALIAAVSIANTVAVEVLLDLDASLKGDGRWSPLDEALYWNHASMVELLLKRGAPVDNLRKAAALGDLEGIRRCFDAEGQLNSHAGAVAWPFGDTIPEVVRYHRLQILNNALVFAAAWGQRESAAELLSRGAEINSIPAGFDYAGTPLHYAALENRRDMVDWLLERGADPAIRDTKVHNTPDGWAEYARHFRLSAYLRKVREDKNN